MFQESPIFGLGFCYDAINTNQDYRFDHDPCHTALPPAFRIQDNSVNNLKSPIFKTLREEH